MSTRRRRKAYRLAPASEPEHPGSSSSTAEMQVQGLTTGLMTGTMPSIRLMFDFMRFLSSVAQMIEHSSMVLSA